MDNEIQEEPEDLNACIDRQAVIIEEQNDIIREIAAIVVNPEYWQTPENIGFHRGYILGLCNNGLNHSIVGNYPDEPDINPLSDQGTPCADTMNSVRTE